MTSLFWYWIRYLYVLKAYFPSAPVRQNVLLVYAYLRLSASSLHLACIYIISWPPKTERSCGLLPSWALLEFFLQHPAINILNKGSCRLMPSWMIAACMLHAYLACHGVPLYIILGSLVLSGPSTTSDGFIFSLSVSLRCDSDQSPCR